MSDHFHENVENNSFKWLKRASLLNLPVVLPAQMASHMKNVS